MFLKHLEPIFKPWRAVRNKIIKVKTTRGNVTAEARRVQRFGRLAEQQKKRASQVLGKNVPSVPTATQPAVPAAPAPAVKPGLRPEWNEHAPRVTLNQVQATGAPMTFAQPNSHYTTTPVPNPPIKIKGFLFWKRRLCTQCLARLDKTWDCCPYCAQKYAQRPMPATKTAAFDISAMTPDQGRLLGWLVPINGPQRGELFTLSPKTVIGIDRTCDIVLQNRFLSGRHAEVVARNGVWVITDLGSTNGTMVNDKLITTHELIDNDFIGFGESILRFKCLYAAPVRPMSGF